MHNNQDGFTLIELLVVISIIGLLASIFTVTFRASLAKARDARKIQNLHALQNAFELYYASYGYYPETDKYYVNPDGVYTYSASSDDLPSWNSLAAVLRPYTTSLKTTPAGDATQRYSFMQGEFTVAGDQNTITFNRGYWFSVPLENTTGLSSSDGALGCGYFEIIGGSYHILNSGSCP